MPGGYSFIVVYNRIPALIAAVEANSKRAPKKVADKMAARMRELAPEDTGYLKSSIESNSIAAGKTAEVSVGAYYAGYVNYGTRYMPATPFFDSAFQEYADEFADEVGQVVGAV